VSTGALHAPMSPSSRLDIYRPSHLKREGQGGMEMGESNAVSPPGSSGGGDVTAFHASPLRQLQLTTSPGSAYPSPLLLRDTENPDSDVLSVAASLDRTLRRIVALESSRTSLTEQVYHVRNAKTDECLLKASFRVMFAGDPQLAAHHRRYLDLELRRERYIKEIEEYTEVIRERKDALTTNEATLSALKGRLDDIHNEHQLCEDEIARVREQVATLAELVKEVSVEVNDRKGELQAKRDAVAVIHTQYQEVRDKRLQEEAYVWIRCVCVGIGGVIDGILFCFFADWNGDLSAIASYTQEASRLSAEVETLEENVDTFERDLVALQAANRRLLAQLDASQHAAGSSFIESAGMTAEIPLVSPLTRRHSRDGGGKLGDSGDEDEQPVVSSRSYQRDTTIEWRQGELLGEGAYSKVYIGMNKVSVCHCCEHFVSLMFPRES
jgi:archaellum component FlaC